MRHRIFIAINLPEDIKKRLIEFRNKWPEELPIRWVKTDNLHITLSFLGYVQDEEIPGICKIIEGVSSRREAFQISLKKIIYGPPKKMPPRMVWVEGEKSKELGKLQKDLENSLYSSSVPSLKESEARPYAPHITLGRIREWEFKQIEPEERPEINENISLSFEVNSIELMESNLKRGGAEYSVLESCPLKS